MVHWIGLDRDALLYEIISAYEGEIEVERSRARELWAKWEMARAVAAALERKGLEKQAQTGQIEAEEVRRRLALAQRRIQQMEAILADFRRDLRVRQAAHQGLAA